MPVALPTDAPPILSADGVRQSLAGFVVPADACLDVRGWMRDDGADKGPRMTKMVAGVRRPDAETVLLARGWAAAGAWARRRQGRRRD